MIQKLLCAISFVIAMISSGHACGQLPTTPIEVIPLNPNTDSPITLRINAIDRCEVLGLSVTYATPTSIRLDYVPGICPPLISLGPVEYQIGLLSAGTYTVDVYFGSLLRGSVTFGVVAAPAAGVLPIPTLSELTLIVLALLVGLFGALRRERDGSRLPMVVSLCLACAASLFATSPGGGGACCC